MSNNVTLHFTYSFSYLLPILPPFSSYYIQMKTHPLSCFLFLCVQLFPADSASHSNNNKVCSIAKLHYTYKIDTQFHSSSVPTEITKILTAAKKNRQIILHLFRQGLFFCERGRAEQQPATSHLFP